MPKRRSQADTSLIVIGEGRTLFFASIQRLCPNRHVASKVTVHVFKNQTIIFTAG